MSDITKKFADFKQKKVDKFEKEEEYTPSNDIVALGKLEDDTYEKITGPNRNYSSNRYAY